MAIDSETAADPEIAERFAALHSQIADLVVVITANSKAVAAMQGAFAELRQGASSSPTTSRSRP
jgi:hypothetical protein